jgi:exopolyphosphatase/pppGpp-phosphohydrolase
MPTIPQRGGNLRRLHEYLTRDKSPKVAVFDIGTKASRILVGPKTPPEVWQKDTFFNDGEKTNFGSFVSRVGGVVRDDNAGLQQVISFMSDYGAVLHDYGMPLEDVTVTGTAVFRWIKNQEDVIESIRRATGLTLHILQGEREAMCGLACAAATSGFRRRPEDTVEDEQDSVLLMIDQGGGSTDISVMYRQGEKQQLQFISLDEIGTVALQEWFLTRSGASDAKVDPATNQRRISTQNNRVRDHITRELAKWPGFSDIAGRRIMPYAMGSAITNCVNGTNFQIHNRKLTIAQMLEIADRQCARIDGSMQQVRTLFNLMGEPTGKDIDDTLTILYGLPVYAAILEKFSLDHLFICGYGLRYGVYCFRYIWNQPLQTLMTRPPRGA